MVVSVVYVLQLTLVFIKPARHCHSNPAIDAAVVANLAVVAATVVVALLEVVAATVGAALLLSGVGSAWTTSHVRRSHEACAPAQAPWQWAVASAWAPWPVQWPAACQMLALPWRVWCPASYQLLAWPARVDM